MSFPSLAINYPQLLHRLQQCSVLQQPYRADTLQQCPAKLLPVYHLPEAHLQPLRCNRQQSRPELSLPARPLTAQYLLALRQ